MFFLCEVERCENIMLTLVKRSSETIQSIVVYNTFLERFYNTTTNVAKILI